MHTITSPRLAIAGLLAALLVLTGCVNPFGLGEPTQKDLTLPDVAALSRLRFPDGTALVSTTYDHFTDWHLTAIATFPAGRLDEFLTANELTPNGPAADGTPERRAVTSADRPGDPAWNPDAATTVLSFGNAQDTIDGVYRRMLLDLDDPATVTLYLDAFTT